MEKSAVERSTFTYLSKTFLLLPCAPISADFLLPPFPSLGSRQKGPGATPVVPSHTRAGTRACALRPHCSCPLPQRGPWSCTRITSSHPYAKWCSRVTGCPSSAPPVTWATTPESAGTTTRPRWRATSRQASSWPKASSMTAPSSPGTSPAVPSQSGQWVRVARAPIAHLPKELCPDTFLRVRHLCKSVHVHVCVLMEIQD